MAATLIIRLFRYILWRCTLFASTVEQEPSSTRVKRIAYANECPFSTIITQSGHMKVMGGWYISILRIWADKCSFAMVGASTFRSIIMHVSSLLYTATVLIFVNIAGNSSKCHINEDMILYWSLPLLIDAQTKCRRLRKLAAAVVTVNTSATVEDRRPQTILPFDSSWKQVSKYQIMGLL